MVDTIPWAPATRNPASTKWYETPGVSALATVPIQGRASLEAVISPLIGEFATISGRASVSANLGVRQKVASTVSGSSSLTGLIGWVEKLETVIQGGATVTADTIVGITQQLNVIIASATTVTPELDVKVKYRPTIEQDTDSDPTHPTSSPRSIDGKTRAFFTPVSQGLTNTTEPWNQWTRDGDAVDDSRSE